MWYTSIMLRTENEKEAVRQALLSLGADVCGFAEIDRFDDLPEAFSPKALFPACCTLICFGVALPKGTQSVEQRMLYGYYNYFCCSKVDRIAMEGARYLEDTFACLAVPLPCDGPYETWDADRMYGHGLLSVKHAAVAAGLGALGKSTLLLNRAYGNRLTLGVVLTDLALPSDALAESICPPACTRCIDSCPASAIHDGAVDQKLCRTTAYGKTARGFDTVDCHTCRTVCPMRFGKA